MRTGNSVSRERFHSTREYRCDTEIPEGYREHERTGLLIPVQDESALKEFVKGWRTKVMAEMVRSEDYNQVMARYITGNYFPKHFAELNESERAAVFNVLSNHVKHSRHSSAANEHGFRDAEASPTVEVLGNPRDFFVGVQGRGDLEFLIDSCMSDDPRFQRKDPNQYRVFTAQTARRLVNSYDAERERKDMIEGLVRHIAENNGYRQTITATAARLRRLEALVDTYPNFQAVTQRLIDQMSAWRFKHHHRRCLQPILLNGPKGCGKTAYAQALAKALDTEYDFVNLAATSMAGVLTGTSEKWGNGQPGLLFKTLSSGKSASPLLLLDEIDKMSDFDGRFPVGGALLALLEPETARHVRDEYSHLPFDASQVFYVATCNDASLISPPLLSRFTTFNVGYPSQEQRRAIIANFLKANYRHVEMSEDALALLSKETCDLRHMKQLIDRMVSCHVQAKLKLTGMGVTQSLRGKQIINAHTAWLVLNLLPQS
ncbi:MAG TPA: AAA family ATPase [Limnobacter sp.]|uniref:AAA family ATPase n=1 Tax=Limnobacter sp. TaxID=2003368 RepID=UPI002ED89258